MRQGRVVRNTYLVVHHRVTNVLNQTAKFIGILDVVEKTLNFPLLRQQNQILMDTFQFPSGYRMSHQFSMPESAALPFQDLSP